MLISDLPVPASCEVPSSVRAWTLNSTEKTTQRLHLSSSLVSWTSVFFGMISRLRPNSCRLPPATGLVSLVMPLSSSAMPSSEMTSAIGKLALSGISSSRTPSRSAVFSNAAWRSPQSSSSCWPRTHDSRSQAAPKART